LGVTTSEAAFLPLSARGGEIRVFDHNVTLPTQEREASVQIPECVATNLRSASVK
jgi:hypothetical protein